jgi:hypothetical protein
MTPWEIKSRIDEIRGYIASPYFRTRQAKTLYAERAKLEKMLEDLTNDPGKQTEDKRKED